MICILKFTKEQNSVKGAGRVTVLVLCALSYNALSLYQVFPKYAIVQS